MEGSLLPDFVLLEHSLLCDIGFRGNPLGSTLEGSGLVGFHLLEAPFESGKFVD